MGVTVILGNLKEYSQNEHSQMKNQKEQNEMNVKHLFLAYENYLTFVFYDK